MTQLQILISIFRLRCPRCGVGKLYRTSFRMNNSCSHCGMSFQAEPGYFVGSLYPNYAVTVALVAGLYWLLVFGVGVPQRTSLWICIGFIAIFPFWFHRYARSIWMAIVHDATRDLRDREPR